jgi:hypothetical protein
MKGLPIMATKQPRVGLLLSFAREIDMYSDFYEENKELTTIIVNNLPTTIQEKITAGAALVEALNEKKVAFVLGTDLLASSQKFDLLFSAGSFTIESINPLKFILNLYSKSFGKLFSYLSLGQYKIPFINKGITGNSFKNNFKKLRNIEHEIGEKCVLLPSGMDLTVNSFPLPRWQKAFDAYICHSKIDEQLIRKKFKTKQTMIVGYPRFQKFKDDYAARKKLNSEFNLDKKRKTAVWVPTNIKIEEEFMQNILLWNKNVADIFSEWNVILRPHPKTWTGGPNVSDILNSLNFIIDNKPDQDFEMLIRGADLVIADYGDPVLSSIFLQKPVLLLNLPRGFKYRSGQENAQSMDTNVRKTVKNFDPDTFVSIKSKIPNQAYLEELSNISKVIAYDIFGSEKQRKNLVWPSVSKVMNELVQ